MPSPVAVWSFWIAVCACAAGQIAILRDAITLRGTRGPPSGTEMDAAASPPSVPATSDTPNTRGQGRIHAAGEMIWAILPGIALIFILLWTWRAMHASAAGAATHAAVATATVTSPSSQR